MVSLNKGAASHVGFVLLIVPFSDVSGLFIGFIESVGESDASYFTSGGAGIESVIGVCGILGVLGESCGIGGVGMELIKCPFLVTTIFSVCVEIFEKVTYCAGLTEYPH